MEILISHVMNKEVTDIEGAGAVNLQVRDEIKLEEEKKDYYDDNEEVEE